MQILIYVILFITFLIPLTILLAVLIRCIAFLISSIRFFKSKFVIKKIHDRKIKDYEIIKKNENKEMESI